MLDVDVLKKVGSRYGKLSFDNLNKALLLIQFKPLFHRITLCALLFRE